MATQQELFKFLRGETTPQEVLKGQYGTPSAGQKLLSSLQPTNVFRRAVTLTALPSTGAMQMFGRGISKVGGAVGSGISKLFKSSVSSIEGTPTPLGGVAQYGKGIATAGLRGLGIGTGAGLVYSAISGETPSISKILKTGQVGLGVGVGGRPPVGVGVGVGV